MCACCSLPFVTFTLTDICLDTYKITILTIYAKINKCCGLTVDCKIIKMDLVFGSKCEANDNNSNSDIFLRTACFKPVFKSSVFCSL